MSLISCVYIVEDYSIGLECYIFILLYNLNKKKIMSNGDAHYFQIYVHLLAYQEYAIEYFLNIQKYCDMKYLRY
jgi:hypothetical protein